MSTPLGGTKLTFDTFGLSDRGRRREVNEDQFLVAPLQRSMLVTHTSLPKSEDGLFFLGTPDALLMMVADGMGGKASGEVASQIAVDAIARYMCNFTPFLANKRGAVRGLRREMRSALVEGDAAIKDASAGGDASMGTTLTLAYVVWPQLYVAHAGDSRCYRWRQGRLEQLTTDHTVAVKLAEQGVEVGEASAMHDMLWNALGGSSESDPEVHRAELEVDDAILLCSDGLTKHVGDDDISAALAAHAGAEAACRALLAQANDDGGSDNITVVIARARMETDAERSEKKRRPSLFRGKLW